MKKPITKTIVEALGPGALVADAGRGAVSGFVARCLPSGKVAFGYRYRDRNTGKRHWFSLGLFGSVTVEQARTLAKRHQGEVADKENPLEAKKAMRAKLAGKDSVANLLDDFMRRYVRGDAQLRSGDDIEGVFDRLVKPRLGKRSIYELRRSDIVTLLDRIEEQRGPLMADRVLAHLRKAFNWKMVRDDAFVSPIVRNMSRTKPKERARDRKLDENEIRQLWGACEHVNEAFRAIIKTLLLTGQRRDEIARMQWDWIKGDALEIPAAFYKTKKPHLVPLTPAVCGILAALPRYDKSPYVFTTNGKTPFSGFSKAKTALDAAIAAERERAGIKAPMPEWRLHDLRRTARSLLSGAGVSSDVAERVLGHAVQGVRGTYDRHEYLAEKRDALERLGVAIDRILNPPGANVVDMVRAKKAKGEK